MASSILPDELLLTLAEQFPCRDLRLKQLAALLSPTRPSPPTLVVYGPRATGKSSILKAFLEAQNLAHAIVRCRECVTGRHLLEKTLLAVHASLHAHATNGDRSQYNGRCDSVSALTVHLQRLLSAQEKFVLVLDGVDKQREAPPTLLPALARIGEFVPDLTIVLVVRYPSPHFLHQTGVPHVNFPAYSRSQSIQILSRKPPDIFLDPPPSELNYDEETHEEDKAWLYPRFCAAVWDSLAENAARDLVAFRDVCNRLWRPFVTPIIKGEFGTRDFSRLLVSQRRLFQDEAVLLDSIVPSTPSLSTTATKSTHELPYYAKWLLLAAYLSSFNPPRFDALYFMKSTERKRRKKGGGTAARSTLGARRQVRKIPRNLLPPSAFTLDRLFAILHAILPHDFRGSMEIHTQVATLASLRLLVRSGGIGSHDVLEPGGKWRVGAAVTWEFAQALARRLRFDVADYIAAE